MTQELAPQQQPGKVAKKQPTLQEFLQSPLVIQKMKNVAAKIIDSEQLVQAVLLQVNRDANLQKCAPASILNCAMVGAQYGWMIGGPRPGMYMVPYGNVATAIPSYFGLQQTAREAEGEWEIEADVVREGDEFAYRKGLVPLLEHTPHADEAPITHAYAIARNKNDRIKFDVMTVQQVEAIRARSRASRNGPWVTDFAEMAKKTVVRRLCKYLPSSPRMDAALALSDQEVDLESAAAAPSANAAYARAKEAAGEMMTQNTDTRAPKTKLLSTPTKAEGGPTTAPATGRPKAKATVVKCPECGYPMAGGQCPNGCAVQAGRGGSVDESAPAETEPPLPPAAEDFPDEVPPEEEQQEQEQQQQQPPEDPKARHAALVEETKAKLKVAKPEEIDAIIGMSFEDKSPRGVAIWEAMCKAVKIKAGATPTDLLGPMKKQAAFCLMMMDAETPKK